MKTFIITIFAILLFANITLAQTPNGENAGDINYLELVMASEAGDTRGGDYFIPDNINRVFTNTTDMNNKLYFPANSNIIMNPVLREVFVSWVKIEIRLPGWFQTRTTFIAGILTNENRVVDPVTTKSFLPFTTQYGYYHIQVTMPNCLTALSPLQSFSGGVKKWNFTESLFNYYRASPLEPPPAVFTRGKWCLWSGDVVEDNVIEAADVVLWKKQAQVGYVGYHSVDCDWNALCDATDGAFIDNNTNKISNAPAYIP